MNKIVLFLCEKFKKFDVQIQKIMKGSFKIYIGITMICAIILFTYLLYPNPMIFFIGISILKSCQFLIVFSVIYGFAFDKIQKQGY